MAFIRTIVLTCLGCITAVAASAQVLFTYGTNAVSKEEFISAFNRNGSQADSGKQSLQDYLKLYTIFKLKAKAAKDQRLDTLSSLKNDLVNFRYRLQDDYPVSPETALKKTSFKRNPKLGNDELFRFADSAVLIPEEKEYPVANKVMFTLGNSPVKAKEWLHFVRDYKRNYDLYKGESNQQLLDSFINQTAGRYYRLHLEEYDKNFKYQLQLFAEGNLVYEAIRLNVWDKASGDEEKLRQFYEANRNHFLWKESAAVVLVNARYYAYAAYAAENMQAGKSWRSIAANSEGMIVADSGRYELSLLPLQPGMKLVEGSSTPIVKNEGDNGAAFASVKKIYTAGQQRSFEEARNLVLAEYQNSLEQQWMQELTKKYPVKLNTAVLQTLVSQQHR